MKKCQNNNNAVKSTLSPQSGTLNWASVCCGGGSVHSVFKRPEVEVIKLNSAKIYRFLQLLSHSRGFFARV
jgi:hypothetical protein